jgi:hypothetical protein
MLNLNDLSCLPTTEVFQYAEWEDNERWELIGGKPRAMLGPGL